MKASPIFPRFDTESNNYEYDLQTDFVQFLEEAKKHASGKETLQEQRVQSQQQQQQEKHVNGGKKMKKKSWKAALYSFFKSSKKNKACSSMVEASLGSHGLKQRTYFSGPVHRHQVPGMAPNADVRHRLASSGPLAGLFHGKKKEEMNDVPYVSLDMVNKPQYGSYGPVYLVS